MTRTFQLKPLALAVLVGCGLAACSEQPADTPSGAALWPQIASPVGLDPAMEQAISDYLARMTIEQKVAQMIQPEIRDITVEDMRRYGFGSYLNGGGAFPNNDKYATPHDWIALAEAMYEASVDATMDGIAIPTMWGTDAVHGHNNVIGATIFPHNIGLGAANNPALIEQIATVTAREVMVTGIDWVFAPTVAVASNTRWGRSYESYAQDPAIVRDYSAAIVRGLQGAADADFLGEQRVISTVKHFIGDGGTTDGVDQGNAELSEQQLFEVHGQGYVGGLSAGAQTVMASFNSWNGEKIHGSQYLLTEVLKEQMGFDGFVVGDWNGHGQIPGCTNYDCPQAANAGLDVYMVPTDAWRPLYDNLVRQVREGVIPLARVDDAVRRILRVKMRAGLMPYDGAKQTVKVNPAARPLAGRTELIGSAEHRAVAREAVRQSLVLLKNQGQLLPLDPRSRILVAGGGADNIGQQAGGWTISWQGTGNTNADFPGGSSIYQGMAEQVAAAGGSVELAIDGSYAVKPDVAVVVFGEQPYAEGNGDIDNVDYQRGNKTDLALLQRLKADGIPVVALFISGRPMWVNAEINAADAFMAVWLPGSEGAGIADVLLRDGSGAMQYDVTGRLPFVWPAMPDQSVLLPLGAGLSYGDAEILSSELPEISTVAVALDSMAIFDRAAQAPWGLYLTSDSELAEVVSSIQQFGTISSRTFDHNVQEDARRFVFAGGAEAGFTLGAAFPRDLRAFVEAGSVLSVQLRVESEVPDDVRLSLYCGDDCALEVSVAEQLRALPRDSWQTLQFDISCWQQGGFDLAQAYSIFGLESTEALTVSILDVRLVPQVSGGICLN